MAGAKCDAATVSGSLCGSQCDWCIIQTLNKIVTSLQLGVVHATVNVLLVHNMHSAFLSMVRLPEK
jgi:hypothetical protein